MEDERGDVGHGNEPLVDNKGVENEVVEDSYEEGEEIMVEIVGSDVFVDGVGGNKEADFGHLEVGGLDGEKKDGSGTTSFSEAMDVSSEGVEGNKVGESESGLAESRDDKSEVVTEEMDVESSETVEVNPEIKAAENVSVVSKEVVKVADPMVVSEEKEIKDEKGVVEEKKEVLPLSDNAMESDSQTVPSEVNAEPNGEGPDITMVDGVDTVVEKVDLVDASKGEAAINPNNGEGLEKLEVDGIESVVEKVDLGDASAREVTINPNHGEGPENLEVDGIESIVEKVDLVDASGGEVSICPNNGEGPENLEGDRIESVVKEVDSVNASAGGELLGDGTPKDDNSFSAKTELKGTNGGCDVEVKSVDEKEVLVAESKDLAVKSDDVVPDVPNENEGCVNDFQGTKTESNNEKTFVSKKGDDNEGEEFVDVLDSKNGELNTKNLPDLSSVGNDECLKSDGDLDKDTVNQNHFSSNESAQVTGGCDSDAVNKDESGPDVETQADTKENLPNDALVDATMGEVIENEMKIVDGDGSGEKVDEIDSEEPTQSLECHYAEIQATTDVKETEDNILCDNSIVSMEVEFDNVVEEYGSPPKKEQEVFVDITETSSDHGVDKIESMDIRTSEVVGVAAVSDITPDITDYSELPVDCTNLSLLHGGVIEERSLSDMITSCDEENKSGEEERESDDKLVEFTSSLKMNQLYYFSPPENEGDYVFSDLVWGKVRSHPWWPGQIFDPADASEKAVKHYKKDSYLVAYFGDRTFAWNESSLLKPFRLHFSQAEKQSNSEAFQNAVTSALEEVSRRVELSLTCSCIPREVCNKIKAQIIENTGIREELNLRYGVDRSSRASYFEPVKFLEYVRDLAPHPSSGADRLDIAIVQAQMAAFYRFEKCRIDAENIISEGIIVTHAPTEAEGELFGTEQNAIEIDPSPDEYNNRVSMYAAKVPTFTSQAPKPSFKIGECIRRVASQLTGSTKDEMVIDDGSPKIFELPERQSMVFSCSVNEMLSQLEVAAQNPKKRHGFLNLIRPFFMGFRSSIALNRRGRKRKAEGGSAEEFEFDDVNDSYWTDRIVQNYSEEQLLNNNHGDNGLGNNVQLALYGVEKHVKPGRKPNLRKRYSFGNNSAVMEFDERVKRRKQESSPAELILNFAERKYIPSEINLNKMFRRFGPLMESETEVDHESGCAKVIFKRGSDAEVALNSSEKFNIFGSVLVNYQIGYEPLISVKVSPLAIPYPLEDVSMMQ